MMKNFLRIGGLALLVVVLFLTTLALSGCEFHIGFGEQPAPVIVERVVDTEGGEIVVKHEYPEGVEVVPGEGIDINIDLTNTQSQMQMSGAVAEVDGVSCGAGTACAGASSQVATESSATESSAWIIVWHGRQGKGEAVGQDLEYVVAYRLEAVKGEGISLEWWNADAMWLTENRPEKDEWGNDSLKCLMTWDGAWKGCNQWETEGNWFPKASWLRLKDGEFQVCEHDQPGCSGQKWTLPGSNSMPAAVVQLMGNLERLENVPDGINIVVLGWVPTKEVDL
ncbi:hypothetical protein ACFLZ1_04625 [Patescibacteria group bacterium]